MLNKQKIKFKEGKLQYDSDYHKNKFGNWINDKNLYRLRSEYAKRNYFDFIYGCERILEFGLGIGQNIAWYNNSYGFDINKELYPMLKSKGINMYNKEEDIPNKSFDIILTCMVLEHLENPIEKVKFLKEKLKDNGVLITVLTGNLSNNRKSGINESIDGHLFGWCFYEINYLLNYCGFKNILNKRIYRYGIERFKFLPDNLYFFMLNLCGKIWNNYDILIISRKEKKNE